MPWESALSLDQKPDGGQQQAPRHPEAHDGHRPPDPSTARSRRVRTALAGVACIAALVLVLVVALELAGGIRRSVNAVRVDPALVTSDKAMLADLWSNYKDTVLETGTGRTVDASAQAITTSEGEGYTMMRAVWSDDQSTFDTSWTWTKDNLQRPDRLMSWKFGRRPDGSYGVQTDVGGQNTASDADVDIAFSLLMAYSRWKDDDYLYDAKPVIAAIWQEEVVQVADRPVLVANDLERDDRTSVLVNPSYFAPYAYRAFAHVDPTHDWAGLVDNSYRVLQDLSTEPLGASTASGLEPDWVRLDRATGVAAPADGLASTPGGSSTDDGYEALRVPWRIALDATWHDEPRARALLERFASAFRSSWDETGSLPAVIHHDGTPAVGYSSAARYGGAIGALDAADPHLSRIVYQQKLLPLYDADRDAPARALSYYDANWMWFGMALHLGELPNLNDSKGNDLP